MSAHVAHVCHASTVLASFCSLSQPVMLGNCPGPWGLACVVWLAADFPHRSDKAQALVARILLTATDQRRCVEHASNTHRSSMEPPLVLLQLRYLRRATSDAGVGAFLLQAPLAIVSLGAARSALPNCCTAQHHEAFCSVRSSDRQYVVTVC